MMRAVVLDGPGPPEALAIRDVPVPAGPESPCCSPKQGDDPSEPTFKFQRTCFQRMY